MKLYTWYCTKYSNRRGTAISEVVMFKITYFVTNLGPPSSMPCYLSVKVFYSNNAAREAFVELCESEYVQRVTFDSYLYKKVR